MDFSIKTDPQRKGPYMAVRVRGRALIINPFTNKGTGFTPAEREELGLHGLVPPVVCTLDQQLERVYDNFQAKRDDLEKYVFLTSLQDRNETLFFRLMLDHLEEMVPIVYTPTVGAACQRFSHIYRRARGLYINYNQQEQIEEILRNADVDDLAVIVATDGERILGLGDQGVGGMGIPIGKLCLYTLCAGIAPHRTLAILLDVGTDNPERLADPLYLGLRQQRIRGAAYQKFIDRFVSAVGAVFPGVLLQWEDFAKGNALHQLARFRNQLCTFNDDIQGTAAVVLAGIYAGIRITNQKLREQRVLLAGAGAAAQGIADLIILALQQEGLSLNEARARIWTFDSKGLVTRDRTNLEDFKTACARDPAELELYECQDRSRLTLPEVILNARPTILLGASGTPGTFDEPVIRAMAQVTERPMIFPLSNPTSRTECSAHDAIRWSGGRAIVATGSPFAPVHFEGHHHRIGQANNIYIFPGVGLGVTIGKVRRVTDEMFLDAAKTLATKVSDEDLRECAVYPDLNRIRECSQSVACAVIRRAVSQGHAKPSALPELEERVACSMWHAEYMPMRYEV
jgi:malic enzyme